MIEQNKRTLIVLANYQILRIKLRRHQTTHPQMNQGTDVIPPWLVETLSR